MNDPLWPTVRKDLRLPYAVERNFEPGMWLPSDIETKAEDRTFMAKLRNLGSAVGTPRLTESI